jgi:hypothetical protein
VFVKFLQLNLLLREALKCVNPSPRPTTSGGLSGIQKVGGK